MAKKRGRGVAAVNYPTGMNLGGDPTQALVHATTTGNFVVSLSSVDLGQGMKSIIAQVCAETLGMPTEGAIIDTADSDTGPHCMGTFASRGHRIGNAVIAAAKEARGVVMEVAADLLEADPADLRTDGLGNVHVVSAPGVSVSVTDVALAAHFQKGRSIAGRGMFFIPRSFPSPTDGAMKPSTCYAHACAVSEVEVDTETGEVDVLSLKCVYEIGRALNPKIVEQQLVGGAWMAMSHALYETTEPYYPSRGPWRRGFQRVSHARLRQPAQGRDTHHRTTGAGRSLRRKGPRRDVRKCAHAGHRKCSFLCHRRSYRQPAVDSREDPACALGRTGATGRGIADK
jgi:CO/xanthine dehydrogenase Mo-binding subunit